MADNDMHPYPQYHLIDDPDVDANTYRFPDYYGTHEPAHIMTDDGATPAMQTIERRIDRVPEPVQIRTPAMIHYPRARDVIIVNSGADIREQKLGFDCRSIVVQNVGTNGFLYCPELNLYLTSGATPLVTFNLPSSINKVSFVWHTAAFNTASPAGVVGQYAVVWLYDEWVPPDTAASGGGGGAAAANPVIAGVAVQSNVAQNVASMQLIAANAGRRDLSVFNDSAAILYISFSGAASTVNYKVQVAAGGYWSMTPGTIYTGAITGIWAAAGAGSARITELS